MMLARHLVRHSSSRGACRNRTKLCPLLSRANHSVSTHTTSSDGWFISEQPEKTFFSKWDVFAAHPDIRWWDGRLHQVVHHFDDSFGTPERLRILRKFGYGGASNVWLAQSLNTNDFVALKVLNNNMSSAINRLPPTCHKWDIMSNLAFDTPPFHRRPDMMRLVAQSKALNEAQNTTEPPPTEEDVPAAVAEPIDIPPYTAPADADHPGRHHVRRARGVFCIWEDQSDPNSEHVAIKLEPLSHNLLDVHELVRSENGYPVAWVKRIARQILQALSFLHGRGVIHTDVHPGNMLLAPGDYDTTQRIIDDLCRADPPPEVQPEGHSLVDRPLQWPVPQNVDELSVKLTDMSSAVWQDLAPEDDWNRQIGTFVYNPPERFLGGQVSPAADIWGFGCSVFNLLTSHVMFPRVPPENPEATWTATHHLLMRQQMLSGSDLEWPESLVRLEGARKYIDTDGLLDHIRIKRPYAIGSFIQHLVPDMPEEEAEAAAVFLRRCITLDPYTRPSADDLLQDPWLKDA